MEIRVLNRDEGVEFIQAIIEPFDFSKEKHAIVIRNFENESKEIDNNRIFFIGSRGNIPVSTVQLILNNADNDPELANGFDTAHIHNLWVRKDQHRRGLAEKIMLEVESYAKTQGLKILTLGVDDYNSPAISLYTKLGYSIFKEVEGRTPQEKLFLMRKAL